MTRFFGKNSGEWRDTSSLEMGLHRTSKIYTKCSYCETIHSVNENVVGMVCNNCGKYFAVVKLESTPEISGKKTPHIKNTKLVKFRDGMEKKAYAWRDKQLKKESPTYHGPIDSKTGKRSK